MLNIQIKLSMSHGGYTIYSYGLQRAYCAVQKKTKSILYQGLIFWKRSKLYKHAYIKWYKFIPAGNERCYNEDVGKYLYENCKIGTYKTK
jgi:hypothetical protein